jgi:hypothetical protein
MLARRPTGRALTTDGTDLCYSDTCWKKAHPGRPSRLSEWFDVDVHLGGKKISEVNLTLTLNNMSRRM